MVDALVAADTDLVIDFLRGFEPSADFLESLIRGDRLRVTALTAFELALGRDFVTRAEHLGALFRPGVLPLDLGAALRAGEIMSELRASGTGIAISDALQAGICVRFDIALATRNRRHYERIAGLSLVDVTPG